MRGQTQSEYQEGDEDSGFIEHRTFVFQFKLVSPNYVQYMYDLFSGSICEEKLLKVAFSPPLCRGCLTSNDGATLEKEQAHSQALTAKNPGVPLGFLLKSVEIC